MLERTALRKDSIANVRIFSILAAALASFTWLVGGGKVEHLIPAEGIASLAEIYSGVESASYQVIANPVLNAALDAYGRAAEHYDVSQWHEIFTAYLDGASRNLLDDALFFDVDDPDRKRLGLGEAIDNTEARAIREAAIGPALAASGQLVWLGIRFEEDASAMRGAASVPYLCAVRLVKRLSDGVPIGILVLLPASRRLAAAFGQALGLATDVEPLVTKDGVAFLVGAKGSILAGTIPVGIGLGLESTYPGGGRILAQEALGIGKGSAELRIEGHRRSVAFAKVPGAEWTLIVSFADAAGTDHTALRWAALLAFALVMALVLRRALTEGTAASAASVFAVADGVTRPFLDSVPRPAGTEQLASAEDSGAAPAWFRELAPRERSIVLLLAAGKSNKEIAAELGIAEQTVKNRLGLVYERLGVRDRVSAALIVSRARLPGGNFPA
jgi:DNA-binding CsgD family transcriptional regulator